MNKCNPGQEIDGKSWRCVTVVRCLQSEKNICDATGAEPQQAGCREQAVANVAVVVVLSSHTSPSRSTSSNPGSQCGGESSAAPLIQHRAASYEPSCPNHRRYGEQVKRRGVVLMYSENQDTGLVRNRKKIRQYFSVIQNQHKTFCFYGEDYTFPMTFIFSPSKHDGLVLPLGTPFTRRLMSIYLRVSLWAAN